MLNMIIEMGHTYLLCWPKPCGLSLISRPPLIYWAPAASRGWTWWRRSSPGPASSASTWSASSASSACTDFQWETGTSQERIHMNGRGEKFPNARRKSSGKFARCRVNRSVVAARHTSRATRNSKTAEGAFVSCRRSVGGGKTRGRNATVAVLLQTAGDSNCGKGSASALLCAPLVCPGSMACASAMALTVT